jgi:hypothetical protein
MPLPTQTSQNKPKNLFLKRRSQPFSCESNAIERAATFFATLVNHGLLL